MTLEEIIALEPEIGAILLEAKQKHGGAGTELVYRDDKLRLGSLAGWAAGDARLRNERDYLTVIRALGDVLGV